MRSFRRNEKSFQQNAERRSPTRRVCKINRIVPGRRPALQRLIFMESNIADVIFIFVLAVFVGFEVISKVPSMLHTPLMSGTNAIHGIILFGGILVLADAATPLARILGFVAVVFGSANVFGGFMVTDRMLQMFKKKKK